jgi:methylamine---glutamate N-methyltransferase subunit A
MCGIVGYLDKSGDRDAPIGKILLRMLNTLSCRGPDSAGVALYGKSHTPNWVLRIKLGERENFDEKGRAVVEQLARLARVDEVRVVSEYLRSLIGPVSDVASLPVEIESLADGLELVSMGGQLEIIKQVGSPGNLERSYKISSFHGTHGIGHTRLSTESRVDLSHSQPFWARGVPDLATVHNGHITNYHKLRRKFEQQGYRFHTENDSEIIGVYLRDRMERGYSLEEGLHASLDDFDGSFCYLVATGDTLAYVKDGFALKPLNVAETDDFVAVATEEITLRMSFPGKFEVLEPGARQVHLWSLPTPTMQAV